MKKSLLFFCSLAICNFVMAFEATSVGSSHIETLKETGKKVVWITGDTAQDLYGALKFKIGYSEKVNSIVPNATVLSDDNKYNDWFCIRINGELSHEQQQAGMSKYNCRTIPIEGELIPFYK